MWKLWFSERNPKPSKGSKSGRTSFKKLYKGSDPQCSLNGRTLDRRLLPQSRPGMKVTWVEVVGVGHGNLDTLSEELTEKDQSHIQFLTQIPWKMELSSHQGEMKVWGGGKITSSVRHLSVGVTLGIFDSLPNGERRFELEEKLGSHQWMDCIWSYEPRWESGWHSMDGHRGEEVQELCTQTELLHCLLPPESQPSGNERCPAAAPVTPPAPCSPYLLLQSLQMAFPFLPRNIWGPKDAQGKWRKAEDWRNEWSTGLYRELPCPHGPLLTQRFGPTVNSWNVTELPSLSTPLTALNGICSPRVPEKYFNHRFSHKPGTCLHRIAPPPLNPVFHNLFQKEGPSQ